MTLWIHPNVGAEEPLPETPPPAVACVARLWSLLFAEGSRRTDAPGTPTARPAPFALAAGGAAWRWLGADPGLQAWWNDAEAARAAEEHEVPLLGPAPEVVRRVHDKGFALAACRAAGYEPRSLRGLARAFSAEELDDPEGVLAAIEAWVGGWPAWIGGRFCLKPRLGGSGRGRVGGGGGGDDRETLRRALPRLARQGGALLEPWLERVRDHSTQLLVQEDGTLTLLASLELRVTASGVYRGHAGRLDHRRRIASGHPDEGLLEAACAVASAAHAEGFRGPCGVDAFVFRGERGPELRPVVELNARFTTGTLVAGLIRLARRRIDAHLPADPGVVRSFEFALAPPEAGWPEDDAETLCLRLGEDPGGFAPALVVRREG